MTSETIPSAPGSPSPAPSDATAPLLVPEDLQALSSSDEATSDWSDASASDVGDVEVEEADDFDLLASQELRQLPSDASSKSTTSSSAAAAATTTSGSRMTLSFPDPVNTSSPTTDSESDPVERAQESPAQTPPPPFSPAPSSTKVRADLDNSILVDGGSYSLLLDAPGSTTTTRVPIELELESEDEIETTSTPPPVSTTNFPSPRPGFLRSNRSSPSSSIVRTKRSPSSSVVVAAAENKVDKWRSTLTQSPTLIASSSGTSSPPRGKKGDGSTETSTIDLSSVNSSQTVLPSSSSTPLARSLSLPNTRLKSSLELEEKYEASKEKLFALDSIPSKLDRIANSSSSSGRPSTNSTWWSRVMIGLTITGVALAGVGTMRIAGSKGGGESVSVVEKGLDSLREAVPVESVALVNGGSGDVLVVEEAEKQSTRAIRLPASVRTSTSILHHTLPTAKPPLSLVDSDSTSGPAATAQTTNQATRVEEPSDSIYRIDPPFSLVPTTSDHDENPAPLEDTDKDEGVEVEDPGEEEHEKVLLKERMIQHAMRCRALENRVENSLFGFASTAREDRKGRLRNMRRRGKGKKERRKRRTVLRIQESGFVQTTLNERIEEEGKGGSMDFTEAVRDAWRFFRGLEKKVKEEVKIVFEKRKEDGRRIGRSTQYPIIRDYYRAKKEEIKSRIEKRREDFVHAKKGVENVLNRLDAADVRGKAQEALGRLKEQARAGKELLRESGGRISERVDVGKRLNEVMRRGETHVKRAARAVKRIEKRDHWQARRAEKKERREKRKEAKRLSEVVSSVSPGDKYIGLALAISSSIAIGTSFIITKKGLISAADQSDGFSSDSYSYLKNGLWWAGMLTIANFAAYTFAPPVLVTPLGALSVLIGAVLAAFFLGERLGPIGISGCSLCLVGSLIIVLHAPEDKEIATVDEILDYALQPGFMFYCLVVLCYSLYAIYRIAPKHGSSNPLVYISICSLVGSVSVMAVKGFGVALKLTFAGNNQLWRAGTWIFAVTVVGCIAVQMNYFNKALDLFPTTVVNPSYFVGFSSCTLLASIILFHGLNTTGGANTLSLLCGLFVICLGVYLLNLSRSENESSTSHRRLSHSLSGNRHSLLGGNSSGGEGMRSSLSANGGGGNVGRLSMQSDGDETRRSTNLFRSGGLIAAGVPNDGPLFDYHGGEDLHMQKFSLREESDEDDEYGDERRGLRTSLPR
ncbi:hypothetical protein JCM16303_005120 [Sporobolomyces ruberrimus]